MTETVPEFFVDGVVDVSIGNSVFRITFGQQDKDNKLRSTLRVLVPANQLGRSLSGISRAAEQIAEKLKGQAAQSGGANKAKDPEPKKKK